MRRIPFLFLAAACLLAAGASSALAAVARTATAPTSSTLPTIGGNANAGQTLTATSGSWDGTTPITYAYQWQRCNSSASGCGPISRATSQNYVASAADVGKTIRVGVTATNADGSNQALSAATAAIVAATGAAPVNTKQPDPSGRAEVGQKVTVDNGKWSGQTPITFSYQWQSCTASPVVCTDIAGATTQSYTVVAAQVSWTLRATVTATNPAGKASAFSNLTSAVVSAGPGAASPVNTTLPSITGALLVGHTIQASTGAWTGLTSNGFAYQWSRCSTNGTRCASISGATGQSYGLGQIDLGTGIRVSVTATNHKGATTAVSNSSLIARNVVLIARFSGALRTSQEVTRPKGTSPRAIGHFTAKLTGKTLRWSLTFSHLTGRPTLTGLTKGLRMSNGAAFKTLCRHCYSPTHGTLTLTSSQVDAMLRGRAYVNIHTVRNSLGEIRGQISRLT